jgi:hypothetical protein
MQHALSSSQRLATKTVLPRSASGCVGVASSAVCRVGIHQPSGTADIGGETSTIRFMVMVMVMVMVMDVTVHVVSLRPSVYQALPVRTASLRRPCLRQQSRTGACLNTARPG